MLKVIIVEDERYTLEDIKEMAEQTGFMEVCGAFENPVEALEASKGMSLKVAFIDIEMPDMDGFTLAERLLDENPALRIVFVTAYSQYAVQAFEINAFDYIMKPISIHRFEKMADKLRKSIPDLTEKNNILSIQCFGTFEVKIDGRSVKWERAKAEELFSYLLINHNRKVHKDVIIEDLWSDHEPAKALVILQTSVYKLRNIFSSPGSKATIKYEGGRYCLSIADCNCDLFWMEKILDSSQSLDISQYNMIEKACLTLEKGFLRQSGYIWSHVKEEELYQRMDNLISKLIEKCQWDDKKEIGLKFEALLKRLKQDEE